MADPLGVLVRMACWLFMLAFALCMTALYSTLVAVGTTDDRPAWVGAGCVGLAFSVVAVIALIVWIVCQLKYDRGFNIPDMSNPVGLMLLSLAMSASISLTAISIVSVSRHDGFKYGASVCALAHLIPIDLILVLWVTVVSIRMARARCQSSV